MSQPNYLVIEIKPYTIKELAGIYKVSKPTFRKWIKPFLNDIGERIGHYYNITQVKIIFDKLSLPSFVKLSEDFEELKEERKIIKSKKVDND